MRRGPGVWIEALVCAGPGKAAPQQELSRRQPLQAPGTAARELWAPSFP